MSGTVTVMTSDAAQNADAGLQKQINDLTARVAKLEGGTVPPQPGAESPEGYTVPANGPSITDALGNAFTITASRQVGINGTADAATANVTQLYYHAHQMIHCNTAGNWYAATMSGGPPGSTAKYAQVASPVPPQPGTLTGFTVTQQAGIKDNLGNKWELAGYNLNWDKYGPLKANLFAKFPKANMCRLVMDRNTTTANVSAIVNELTGRKMVVFIDYHDAVYSGTIAWYQTMVSFFKSNPLCFMETPNEPGGNVASDQINIINAIRTAGWTNPIGLEIVAGWKFDNVGPVMAQCPQNNQIFLCPHNYGNWWVGNMENQANATGLYSVVDEFGNSTDGSNIDSNGAACVQSIIQSQQQHRNGATVWSATNNFHPADNLFLDPAGNTLSEMGKQIQNLGWLV